MSDMLKRLRAKKRDRKVNVVSSAVVEKVAAQKAEQANDREQAQATQEKHKRNPLLGKVKASLKVDENNTVWVKDIIESMPEIVDENDTVTAAITVETINTLPKGKNEISLNDLNEQQLAAVGYGKRGESFCLIGGAGTGKTTTQRVTVAELVSSGVIGKLAGGTNKVLSMGAPSIAVVSFTNKAVSNIKSALPEEFKPHCSTMHKLVEFKPEDFEEEVIDSYGQETGEVNTTRRFVPTYGKDDNDYGDGLELPHLDVIIIEEAGSVPTSLFNILIRALPSHEDTIFIFLGDLNQLPPVFGDAILGFKLLDLPIVELTKVYRQALKSPITSLATTIQKGRNISDVAMAGMAGDFGEHGVMTVTPFSAIANKLTGEDSEKMSHNFGKHLYKQIIAGEFLLDTDVVLIPFNKRFGTIELNKWAGQAHRDMNDLVTYHVIAGREQYFLCEGDRIMFDKQDCKIVSIEANNKYMGEPVIMESKDLDRWGRNRGNELLQKKYTSFEDMAELLDTVQIVDGDDKVNQCSHTITVESLEYEGRTMEVTTAAEMNSILPTNVLTIHKSQGSEWRKVWLVLHASHATMWKRELLYTGVTRARHTLEIFYSGEQRGKIAASAFQKGVTKSEFKGITLEHKLDYFRNKRKAEEMSALAEQRRMEREAAV